MTLGPGRTAPVIRNAASTKSVAAEGFALQTSADENVLLQLDDRP